MYIGDFPQSLSQAMLVGTMLVGRLGVCLFNPTGSIQDLMLRSYLKSPNLEM